MKKINDLVGAIMLGNILTDQLTFTIAIGRQDDVVT
jgi:hypothetical protein